MSTPKTNEAAERLLEYLEEQDGSVDITIKRTLDAALAAERQPYVEALKTLAGVAQIGPGKALDDALRQTRALLDALPEQGEGIGKPRSSGPPYNDEGIPM